MLAVITDDFTGASEIAGIALAKGYRTVIETKVTEEPDADVIVIATNMRSLDRDRAASKSAAVTREVLALKPDLIFKKVDSVLRGNVGSELEAQMAVENKAAALLVPANPSRHRTIADGVYFVDDKPVAESGFGSARYGSSGTSHVVDILRNSGASSASSVSLGDPIEIGGVQVGNAVSGADMSGWAGRVSDKLVPAGAADFFAALLDTRTADAALNGAEADIAGPSRRLYLCGSGFPSSREAVMAARAQGGRAVEMPDEVYFSDDPRQFMLDRWASDVIAALSESDRVIVAALQSPGDNSLSPQQITLAMAEVARQAVANGAVDELLIEGGATSQAVIAALDIERLYPSQSLAPGVTRMRVDNYPGLHITMKPGSYRWPAEIWDFN